MTPSVHIRWFIAAAVALGLASVCTAPARAENPFAAISATTSTSQAGAHPDLSIDLSLTHATGVSDDPTPGSPFYYVNHLAHQFVVQLPPGLLGNPSAFPTCSSDTQAHSPALCPPASQVGLLTARTAGPSLNENLDGTYSSDPYGVLVQPIFNMPPGPGDVARLGVAVVGGNAAIRIDVGIRDGSDYGLTATVSGLTTALPFYDARVDLWGVPAAHAHDQRRIGCFDSSLAPIPNCSQSIAGTQTFIVNPTSCGPGAPVTAQANFYGDPATYSNSTTMAPVTGCSALSLSATPSLSSATGAVGQPDAFQAGLTVPQPAADDQQPGDTAPAVSGVSVKLPAGVSLSPGVANGLTACSDGQFARGTDAPAACPDSSKIGSVRIVTPLLAAPLTGSVYVGSQESSDPASGEMYRLLLDAVGQGVDVKLVGDVAADPSTGQLTATFPNDPQVPFSNLQLSFAGGANAALANPPTCGTATSEWSLTSWSAPEGSPLTASSSFPVSGDCGRGSTFSPSLSAGTASNRAGGSSPFSFTLSRPDGERDISGIPQITLPAGLNADIASVPLCGDVSACSSSSRVGSATIVAGTGSGPFSLAGQPVYLTGPYRGAPYGLAVVAHALAGPFDLGTVVVRQALFIDPTTAAITVKSDPLPTILGGVPLHIRSVSVAVDRPGFMRSPTSCRASTIGAQVTSAALGSPATVAPGTSAGYVSEVANTAKLSTPFQLGHCSSLHFSPKLAITLGGNATKVGSHPKLSATLTQPAGQANLRSVGVALPLSLALDPNNSQHVCSIKAAAAIACPAKTIVGTAAATTRILPLPLSAKVYLVQGIRYDKQHRAHKTLPTLLIPLRGKDGVAIDLTAKSSVNRHEQLVATFGSIPDAAIAKFNLTISGGKRGILAITGDRSLCKASRQGDATEIGQNGTPHNVFLGVSTPACRTHH